jgi:hypothetical protein
MAEYYACCGRHTSDRQCVSVDGPRSTGSSINGTALRTDLFTTVLALVVLIIILILILRLPLAVFIPTLLVRRVAESTVTVFTVIILGGIELDALPDRLWLRSASITLMIRRDADEYGSTSVVDADSRLVAVMEK